MAQSIAERTAIVNDLIAQFGKTATRQQVKDYEKTTGKSTRFIRATFTKIGRGQYALADGAVAVVKTATTRTPKVKAVSAPVSAAPTIVPSFPTADPVTDNDANTSLAFAVTSSTSKSDILARIQALASEASAMASVPKRAPAFVPFGDFDVTRQIIKSRQFCPVFITGLSGNGKTFGIEQACAMESREYIRINITTETDEDDLIGGFRLKNGETVFELGPVPVAMLRGAVITIDEIDLGGSKIMCLQPVLEGKPLTIKKLGITISPVDGFTIFATANTKGTGNEDGKFVGTNLLNEAFLERFPITIEQAYPSITTERKILMKTFEGLAARKPNEDEATFFDTLSKWAEAIRTTYFEGGVDDLISTRRLTHIVKTYAIFGDKDRALALCLNRFDKTVQAKFLDFYSKLSPDNADDAPTPTVKSTDDIPF